ncbi:pentapeptide repeat-containing protein [Vibrio navarrensis]|nr:pentapeptide repeat-containing protein [Vibrio navarrensis]
MKITLCNDESYFDQVLSKLEHSDDSFEGIEFEECQFTDCDFSNTKFQRCKFNNCEFERCNLSLADFSASTFYGITFIDCKLIGVDWAKANWPIYHRDFELSFQRCILNDSSFFALTLNALKFNQCKLHDVDFREGNFNDSTMTACDFSRSLFMRTQLQKVDFSDSEGYEINLLDNQLKGAKFSRYEALSLLESLGIDLVD